jgi:hypothetical protein
VGAEEGGAARVLRLCYRERGGGEDGVYVVAVNRRGMEQGRNHIDCSMIVDPVRADIVALASSDTPELLVATVDLDNVATAQTSLPWWRDRRPELYAFRRRLNVVAALRWRPMSEVEQIEDRIRKLSAEDLARLRAWFAEFDAQAWDRQIESDSTAGKLDRPIEKSVVEHKADKSTPL